MTTELTRGSVHHITSRASPQFEHRTFDFEVIRCHTWPADVGWVWLDGYELDGSGGRVARRSILVRIDGLTPSPTE